jgi:chemotaxis protein methyltransferase CheR
MVAVAQTSAAASADAPTWDAARRYLLRHCGVVLSEEQHYLLEPRLAPVAKLHHFPSVAAFVAEAGKAAPMSTIGMALIDALTTHETMFFRDPAFWKALEKQVLPGLLAAAPGGGLRLWSAACSTGQEVYSLTMLLTECFPATLEKSSIYATDVSALAVARASAGIFSTLEVNRGLGAMRLHRHFGQAHGGFQIAETLRKAVAASPHNLLGGTPDQSGCDLVLCRNVLIYFSDIDRAAVIQRLFQSVKTGGIVAIGATESIRGMQPIAPGLYVKS